MRKKAKPGQVISSSAATAGSGVPNPVIPPGAVAQAIAALTGGGAATLQPTQATVAPQPPMPVTAPATQGRVPLDRPTGLRHVGGYQFVWQVVPDFSEYQVKVIADSSRVFIGLQHTNVCAMNISQMPAIWNNVVNSGDGTYELSIRGRRVADGMWSDWSDTVQFEYRTVLQRTPVTAPAPVATAPAPVATAPAPVATAPAPVATAPAPVATQASAPVPRGARRLIYALLIVVALLGAVIGWPWIKMGVDRVVNAVNPGMKGVGVGPVVENDTKPTTADERQKSGDSATRIDHIIDAQNNMGQMSNLVIINNYLSGSADVKRVTMTNTPMQSATTGADSNQAQEDEIFPETPPEKKDFLPIIEGIGFPTTNSVTQVVTKWVQPGQNLAFTTPKGWDTTSGVYADTGDFIRRYNVGSVSKPKWVSEATGANARHVTAYWIAYTGDTNHLSTNGMRVDFNIIPPFTR